MQQIKRVRGPGANAWVLGAVLTVVGWIPQGTVHAAEPSAAAVVDSFHSALLASMKTGGSCAGRRQPLAAEVDRDFDLPFLAQRVLRKRWIGMNETQHSAFTALFRDLVVSTYTQNFSSFSGEKFTDANAQDLPDGTQMIKSKLLPAHGSPVEFDYVLRKNGEHWQVVNILADGVSNLALWSSQYEKIFADQGYDGLMKQLGAQIDKINRDCAA